jgi:NAD+ kinase
MSDDKLIGLVYNSQLPKAKRMTEEVSEALRLGDRCWVSSAADLSEMQVKLRDTSLIIIAGGDGTILRIVRVIAPYGVPLLGINMGRVGFMAELKVEDTIRRLPEYLNGGVRVEERMMLQASVTRNSEHGLRAVGRRPNSVS